MTTANLALVAGISAFLSIVLIIAGTVAGSRKVTIETRLELMGRPLSASDEDLRAPIVERVWRPIISSIATPVTRITPQRVTARLQRTIQYAGLGNTLDVTTFVAARALAMVGGWLFGVALVLAATGNILNGMGIGLGIAAVAYLVPTQWLQGKAKRRQSDIRLALPDALDLLLLCLSAMSPERALARVGERAAGPLREEFQRLRAEMVLRDAHDALRTFADRIGLEEIRSLVAAMIQSDTLGSPLSQQLTLLADDIRVKRRQRAETLAREAPIKMIFPLVLLILPPLFIVILGPSVPQILHSLVPGLHL